MHNTKVWKVIRWISILPSLIIGMYGIPIIVYFIFHFILDMESDSYVLGILVSLSSGIACIVFGVEVAPSHKKIVAFILLILVVLLDGATFYATLKQEKFVFDTIKLCASLIGSILAYIVEISLIIPERVEVKSS